MSRLSERRKDLMKSEIYAAAVDVLTRHGLDAMTMDRVAEQAGVAKGSVYNYFRSKHELIEFVFEKTVAPLQDQVRQMVDAPGAATDKLRALFHMLFSYVEQRRGLFNLLFNEPSVHKLISPARSPVPPNLTRIIEQGIGEGVFRPCDSRLHAIMVFGALRGLCESFIATEKADPIEELSDMVTRFCVEGLVVSTVERPPAPDRMTSRHAKEDES